MVRVRVRISEYSSCCWKYCKLHALAPSSPTSCTGSMAVISATGCPQTLLVDIPTHSPVAGLMMSVRERTSLLVLSHLG